MPYTIPQMEAELAQYRDAKFQKGIKMTVEQVSAVVGPEFKEMNENPPPSVVKVREEMEGKTTKTAYFTVIIPPVKGKDKPTKWHGTKTLQRGAFDTKREADAWAEEHIPGSKYSLKKFPGKVNPGKTAGRGFVKTKKSKLPNVNGVWSSVDLGFHPDGTTEITLHTRKKTDFSMSTHISHDHGPADFDSIIADLKKGKMPKGFKHNEGAKFKPGKTGSEEEARFEEGVPADPTENMSEEEAKKWRLENLQNRDNFKESSESGDAEQEAEGAEDRAEADEDKAQAEREEADAARTKESAMSTRQRLTWKVAESQVPVGDEPKPDDPEIKGFQPGHTTPEGFEPGHKTADSQVPVGDEGRDETDVTTGYEPGSVTPDGYEPGKVKTAGKDKPGKQDGSGPCSDDPDCDCQKKEAAQAAAGLYGYTKAVQRDCEASVRKLQRRASAIARKAWQKDEKVAAFLTTHAKRGKSRSARILLTALKNMGPKVSSDKTVTKEAAVTSYGMYGFPSKTARLGLAACMDVRDFAGTVSADLHRRKASLYEPLTGFLGQHTKAARCNYSRMILGTYPDASIRIASAAPKGVAGWISWED